MAQRLWLGQALDILDIMDILRPRLFVLRPKHKALWRLASRVFLDILDVLDINFPYLF